MARGPIEGPGCGRRTSSWYDVRLGIDSQGDGLRRRCARVTADGMLSVQLTIMHSVSKLAREDGALPLPPAVTPGRADVIGGVSVVRCC